MIYFHMLRNSSSRCLHFFRPIFFWGWKVASANFFSLFECMVAVTQFNFKTYFIYTHSVLGKEERDIEICHLSECQTHKVGDNEESAPPKDSKAICSKLSDNLFMNKNKMDVLRIKHGRILPRKG